MVKRTKNLFSTDNIVSLFNTIIMSNPTDLEKAAEQIMRLATDFSQTSWIREDDIWDKMNQLVHAHLDKEKFTKALKHKPNDQKPSGDTNGNLSYLSKEPQERHDEIKSILGERFIAYNDADSVSIAIIEDTDLQIVKTCPDDDKFLKNLLFEEAKSQGFFLIAGGMANTLEVLQYQPLQPYPHVFAQPDDEGWCFERARIIPEDGDIGPWKHVADRFKPGVWEDFISWLYGVYSNRYKGRRLIYLYGDGEEGKTFLCDLLGRHLFGRAYGVTREQDVRGSNNFALSDFETKKLVLYDDSGNKHILKFEMVKKLCQGEQGGQVKTEKKYQTAKFRVLPTRLIVNSNVRPDLSSSIFSERSQTSRVLFAELSLPTVKPTEDELIAALPQLLHLGRTLYESKVDHHGEIQLSEDSLDDLNDILRQSNTEKEEWFKQNFVYEKGSTLAARIIRSSMLDFFKLPNQSIILDFREELNAWLAEKKGIVYDDSNEPSYINISLMSTEGHNGPDEHTGDVF